MLGLCSIAIQGGSEKAGKASSCFIYSLPSDYRIHLETGQLMVFIPTLRCGPFVGDSSSPTVMQTVDVLPGPSFSVCLSKFRYCAQLGVSAGGRSQLTHSHFTLAGLWVPRPRNGGRKPRTDTSHVEMCQHLTECHAR